MGAFFLYRDESELDLDDARTLFERKGFAPARELALGSWRLWLYRKMLVPLDNYFSDDEGWSVFACGTVVYRSLGYRDSLKRLLADFRANRLDQEELIGGFCLLFWDGRKISILRDRSRIYKVFGDDARSCLSSSFLAMVEVSPLPLALNRLAVCEKIATGFILGPDTLVDGIREITINHTDDYALIDGIGFEQVLDRPKPIIHAKGREDSLERQISVLGLHGMALNTLNSEMKGLLGLSSGYDSRLLLACTKVFTDKVNLYTHDTQGVHAKQHDVIQALADIYGMPLATTSTRSNEDHTLDQAADILNECMLFFDASSSRQRGAFHETYTRQYNEKVLAGCGCLFHGVGGELYRNHTHSMRWGTPVHAWFERHVIFPFAKEVIGDSDLYEAMFARMLEKVTTQLGDEGGRTTHLHWLRRYYSEVRMMASDAHFVGAFNQMVHCHAPFLDAMVIAEGLGATPYIGNGSVYESELIVRLDSKLASIPTEYGFAPNNISVTEKTRALLRSVLPDALQTRRVRRIKQKAIPLMSSKLPLSMEFVDEMKLSLEDVLPNSQFKECLNDHSQMSVTLSLAYFLKQYGFRRS